MKQVNIHREMTSNYRAEDIEVLTGLEPVKRRPGMYTDTTRPNHLAMEVIDNSVDEALAGHASRVSVTAFEDGSVEVIDDGRGMPVDIHPEQEIPGVELILTQAARRRQIQRQKLPVRGRAARRRCFRGQRPVAETRNLDQARRRRTLHDVRQRRPQDEAEASRHGRPAQYRHPDPLLAEPFLFRFSPVFP